MALPPPADDEERRGRVLLLGEHQQALGLGVITLAPDGVRHETFGATPSVQRLAVALDGLLVIGDGDDASERAARDAGERTRRTLAAAVAELHAVEPALDLAEVSYESIWNVMLDARAKESDPALAATRERLVFAALSVRDLVLAAARTLTEPPLDRARLGELLDQEHAWLRDGLGLSSALIDGWRAAALAAGALGSTVRGAGLLAYAPGREEAVAAAVARLGARARRLSASGPA